MILLVSSSDDISLYSILKISYHFNFLIIQGFAKYVEWSANMMEEEAKRKLKTAELQAKKNRLRMWTNYVPPATNSKAIHDQNFTGKVVFL